MDPSYHSRPPAIVILPPASYATAAARVLADAIRRRAAEASIVSIALSGGRSPQPVHAALAVEPGVPWDRVRVFFGDERGVPPDHPDSNFGMAHRSLLAHVPLDDTAVARMQAERRDRDAAAIEYGALLPEILDVLVLGLGADGHTCSLFPRSPAMRESLRAVVPSDAPDPPRERLTITPPVIARARETVMLVTGRPKAAAVREALRGVYDPAACPGQLARNGTWILDTDAASALT